MRPPTRLGFSARDRQPSRGRRRHTGRRCSMPPDSHRRAAYRADRSPAARPCCRRRAHRHLRFRPAPETRTPSCARDRAIRSARRSTASRRRDPRTDRRSDCRRQPCRVAPRASSASPRCTGDRALGDLVEHRMLLRARRSSGPCRTRTSARCRPSRACTSMVAALSPVCTAQLPQRDVVADRRRHHDVARSRPRRRSASNSRCDDRRTSTPRLDRRPPRRTGRQRSICRREAGSTSAEGNEVLM